MLALQKIEYIFNYLISFVFNNCVFKFLNFIKSLSVLLQMHVQTVNCIQHDRTVGAVGLCGLHSAVIES